MIKKVIKIKDLKDARSFKEDLDFWLKKSPEKRVEAVDFLRRQYHGRTTRPQRVVRVIHLKKNGYQ